MSVRTPPLPFESRSVRLGLLAGDTGSSRLVYAMVLALIVIGVVLIVLAVVVYRRTRVDPSVLAPLERMGSRKWRKSDEESRRELLDAVRPAGASPGEPGDAPVDLPPPVIEPVGESPHEATFVAGPEGIEPVEAAEPVEGVELTEGVEPVEAAEPVEGVESVEGVEPGEPVEPVETIEPSEPAQIETAPVESADDAAAPAEVVSVAIDEADEPAASDDAVAASDDAALPDQVAASDDGVESGHAVASEDSVAAPDAAHDDEGAPADDSVGYPAEPVDDSVAGK